MKKSGIYRIVNKVNEKCYVGSSVNLINRLHNHYHNLKRHRHDNIILQAAWNKYGEECFKFEMLLFCEKEILLLKEQEMINFYHSVAPNGYNICPIAGNCLGKKHSEEAKAKMRGNTNGRGRKGLKCTDESKRKMSIIKIGKPSIMKGKHHSEETKLKIRLAKLGKPHPNNSLKGRKLSEETKLKIGNSGRGKKRTEETKLRISNSLKGRTLTDETKLKIGNSRRGMLYKKRKST